MAMASTRPSRRITPSGLWVAALGFFVTRFTVSLAASESRAQFFVSGIVPLVLGLLLAAAGVALLVGSFDRSLVRSVAVWCTAGTIAMGALVALTVAGASPSSGAVMPDVVLSNFLIGGAILGGLTGLYAGWNDRSRAELRQQANRLETINRLLRHEVLNAIAVIRGRAETVDGRGDDDAASAEHILRESDRIADTVEDVKYLARSSVDGLVPVDLVDAVETCLEDLRAAYPAVEFVGPAAPPSELRVWADGQLVHALSPLLENAAAYGHGPEPTVTVDVAAGQHAARVSIADTGPGLPPEHRATLERGAIADYDDPGAGFGTNVARLFVESYGGDIDVDVTDEGSTVAVELPLASERPPTPTGAVSIDSVGVDRTGLLVAIGGALLAGVVMGVFLQVTAGVIPVIGALYGVADPLVGWITHLFHSVVFGLIYAGALAGLPTWIAGGLRGRLVVALGWALALWLFAAGLIMPIWLNLVGIPAPLPNVSLPALWSHLLWGLVLGVTFHVGTSRWD